MIDTHVHFLNDVPRLASPEFIPTTQDVLHSRIQTTSAKIEKYQIDGTNFEICDVGEFLFVYLRLVIVQWGGRRLGISYVLLLKSGMD